MSRNEPRSQFFQFPFPVSRLPVPRFSVLRFDRYSAVAIVASLLATAACRDRAADDAAAADSALARDLTLATTVAAPTAELRDTPDSTPPVEQPLPPEPPPRRTPVRAPVREQPRPVVSTPAPSPPPVVESPEPAPAATPAPAPTVRTGVIGAGTTVGLSLDSRACSNANRPGDKMVAHTAEAVTGTNGVVFPAGSAVVVEVASVVQSGSADSSTITFRVKTITADGVTHPVTGDVLATGTLEKTRVETRSADQKKVLAGAILGAIVGRVAGGGGKGTVIGAATGAAVGAAAAAATARYETCVPAGAPLRLTIREPVEVELPPS